MPTPEEINKSKKAAEDYFSSSDNASDVEAAKREAESKRINAIKLKDGNVSYTPTPSSEQKSKAIKQRFNQLREEKAKYTESPLYLERLKKLGVSNPEQVQKERAALERGVSNQDINVVSNSMAGSTYVKSKPTGAGVNVQLNPEDTEATMMHEIGHITNRYATNYPNQGQGSSYAAPGHAAPYEDFFILNRSNVPKKRIGELYDTFRKQGNAKINPTVESPRPQQVSQEDVMLRGAADTHYEDTGEMKSDLEAVRLLMRKSGITKQFGDNITPEQLQRAMKTKGIGDEMHFQRMLKNFNPDKIVELNNRVAQVASKTQQNTV